MTETTPLAPSTARVRHGSDDCEHGFAASFLARARCHTIPAAGHAVTLEAPNAVNEAIRTHIDTH